MEAIARIRIGGCHWTGERLSAYLEDDLGAVARWIASRHLSRCERCRMVLRSLARTVEQLGLLREHDGPPTSSQAEAVIDRVRRGETEP